MIERTGQKVRKMASNGIRVPNGTFLSEPFGYSSVISTIAGKMMRNHLVFHKTVHRNGVPGEVHAESGVTFCPRSVPDHIRRNVPCFLYYFLGVSAGFSSPPLYLWLTTAGPNNTQIAQAIPSSVNHLSNTPTQTWAENNSEGTHSAEATFSEHRFSVRKRKV